MIIEIKPSSDGAHNNQGTTPKIIPDGWAKVPEGLELPNFPFGEVETEEVDGVMTVTKWTPLPVPETNPIEPEIKPTELEQLRADVDYIAIMTGVEL